jgi:hypothetical protein
MAQNHPIFKVNRNVRQPNLTALPILRVRLGLSNPNAVRVPAKLAAAQGEFVPAYISEPDLDRVYEPTMDQAVQLPKTILLKPGVRRQGLSRPKRIAVPPLVSNANCVQEETQIRVALPEALVHAEVTPRSPSKSVTINSGFRHQGLKRKVPACKVSSIVCNVDACSSTSTNAVTCSVAGTSSRNKVSFNSMHRAHKLTARMGGTDWTYANLGLQDRILLWFSLINEDQPTFVKKHPSRRSDEIKDFDFFQDGEGPYHAFTKRQIKFFPFQNK